MSKKLLLADDSVTIQRVIELTFSGEDVQVLAVGDGEEAIARIASDRPDIVLADIGMPKRSGYEVSAFVKGKPELSHIPVLLLAGAFEPVDDAKAREAGCDGVLVKPFEPHYVIARVRELIDGAKGSPTLSAVPDVPRPAAALTAPRPVEALRRADKAVSIPDDLMDNGEDDLLPHVDDLLPQDDLVIGDDLLPKVEDFESMSPPILLDDTLDDYFDKLDEAFSTIGTPSSTAQSSGSPSEAQMEHLAPIHLDHGSVPTLDDLLADIPESPKAAEISFESFDIDEPIAAEQPHVIDFASSPSPQPVAVAAPPLPIEPADLMPTLVSPPSLPAHDVPEGRSIVADAFSALLAVEQGEPGAVLPRLPGNGAQPVVTEVMIDDLARRVIERLALGSSDRMQAIVKDVVSGVAERLVRAEIDRIRSGQ